MKKMVDTVRAYLKCWNRDTGIIEMDASTATVAEAAAALGVIPARIAKSISLHDKEFPCTWTFRCGVLTPYSPPAVAPIPLSI
jgi:hypothetical protein